MLKLTPCDIGTDSTIFTRFSTHFSNIPLTSMTSFGLQGGLAVIENFVACDEIKETVLSVLLYYF